MGLASAAGVVAAATPAHAVSSDAYAYLTRINHERRAHGLRPLTMRTDLNSIAQRWANHMAAANLLSHNPRLATQITNWQIAGENVGEGPDIPTLDSAFWHSPEHRANILTAGYRDVGIATARANGILWITVDFRKPMYAESSATIATPHTATARAPRAVRHRTLRVGSRGFDVKRVQRKLHVRADGVFGPVTKRAVVRFQRHHHLRANGVVRAGTWKALHL
jgi:peptidoglycan hydrolase-like protein with peptidoglycan-binding domain